MADIVANISSKPRFFRKVIIVVLIFVAFFSTQPITAMASTAEVQPHDIFLTDFEYRLGDPAVNEAGIPLWAAESTSKAGTDGAADENSGEWKPYRLGTFIEVPEADKYIWFRTTLPEHSYHGAILSFFDVGNSMDIYLDEQTIYSNHYIEQPGLRRINEYYYSMHAELPGDCSGKTVYIRARPKALFNKNNIYALNYMNLTSYENHTTYWIAKGYADMILGFILIAAGLVFILLLLFVKVDVRTMLSLGMLSITSGTITLYQSYFIHLVHAPTLFYYVAFICNTLMPVAVFQFFRLYVPKKFRKPTDIMSMAFITFTIVMVSLDLFGLYSAFTFIQIFFAAFALCSSALFVPVLKNKENSPTETRIILIGSCAYALTGLYDIVYVILISDFVGTQYHTWGLLVMIISLVFSMVYRYNEAHKKVVVYSKELEEKNINLNEAWNQVKTAHDSITELNRSLEQKVAERTDELKNANSDLTELNEELTAMNEQLIATMDALTDAQAQLIQTEKIAALGKLVAGVAHELNTPVAAISSNIQFEEALYGQVDLADISSMDTYFTSIEPLRLVNKEAGERITAIVRNLTNFSRLDESDLKEVNLIEGIDSTVAVMGEQIYSKRITIVKELSYIPNITCYPKLMNQVFMDLLENAIEAVSTGGIITISTSCSSKIYIKFKDNGRGIPANDLQKVFDPRFTTKGERVGIGLGLPLSYRVIEKHGGSISVNSTPGEGSEFIIELPFDRQVS